MSYNAKIGQQRKFEEANFARIEVLQEWAKSAELGYVSRWKLIKDVRIMPKIPTFSSQGTITTQAGAVTTTYKLIQEQLPVRSRGAKL